MKSSVSVVPAIHNQYLRAARGSLLHSGSAQSCVRETKETIPERRQDCLAGGDYLIDDTGLVARSVGD